MENKYLGLNSNAIMYTTNMNNNIVIKNKEGQVAYDFFTVNSTGKMIIEEIRGTLTVQQFVEHFVEMTNIDYEENKNWILEFISTLLSKGAVILSEVPVPCEKIKNIGDSDLISPMHATIEVTDKCNLKCKHCYLSASPNKSRIMTFNDFIKIKDKLTKNMVVNIEFTGGELFVNPDIYEILQVAYEEFAIVGILTNGTILSDNILELLVKNAKKTVINVSIDSIHKEVHDQFRNMNGAFEKTCKNVKRLTDKGLFVRIASSIFKENMWEIDKLAELAIDLGAKAFTFNFVEEFGRGNDIYRDAYSDLKVNEYLEYLNGVIEKYKNIIPIQQGEGLLGTRNCGAGVNSIVIDPDGDIRPCVLSSKWCCMGNLLSEEFESIMKYSIYKDLAAILPPHKDNGCDANCKYLSYCKGCYIKGFQTCKNEKMKCSWIKENKLERLYKLYSEEK